MNGHLKPTSDHLPSLNGLVVPEVPVEAPVTIPELDDPTEGIINRNIGGNIDHDYALTDEIEYMFK